MRVKWDVVIKDMIVLIVFVGVPIGVGVVLAPYMSNIESTNTDNLFVLTIAYWAVGVAVLASSRF